MGNQISVLKGIGKPKCIAEGISGNLTIGCKHVIPLSEGAYCALQRRKIDRDTCRSCPDFSPEPTEYRLFRRE